MSYFNWNERYRLDIAPMDREHQLLIELMNRLHELYECKANHLSVKSAFLELERRTVEHFQHEEGYLASIGYQQLNVHREIHRQLLEQLAKHRAAIWASREALNADVFGFLKLWLSAHICGIDQKYAVFSRSAKHA